MTVRLLADENLDGDLLRALLRRLPTLDIVRVQDVGLSGVDDPAVLEWAAHEGRVVLTHDLSTMPAFAYARLRAGQALPGLVAIPLALPIGHSLDDLLLLLECGAPSDFEGRVQRLPLR